jgi:3-deoxy-D-manno-octulosonic-acid transferase
MKYIWLITYNVFFLPLFWVVLRILSPFNKKIRDGFKARKHFFKELPELVSSLDGQKKNILLHCSSLGEFEQAKPIIDILDKTNKFNFIISFFSTSGYKHFTFDSVLISKYAVVYLPFDSPDNIKRFIKQINISAAIFIKYDLWLNLLNQLDNKNIFTMLVNATYREKALKWKFIVTRSYRKLVYNFFKVIATSDKYDAECLRKILSKNVRIYEVGDTKVERIRKAKSISQNVSLIKDSILKNHRVFVVGSSWEADDSLILPVLENISSKFSNNGLSLLTIIAPHEPTEENITEVESLIKLNFHHLKTIRYSNIKKYSNENIIIIDRIGLLMTLYKYADIAYVGGGLHSGLHNVLEPAGHGLPVLFGNHKISGDAETLIDLGGGIAIETHQELYDHIISLLKNDELRKEIGKKSLSVFEKQNDSSKKITDLLISCLEEENH